MSSIIDESEIRALAARHGDPLRWTRTVVVEESGDTDWVQKKDGRNGEVMFVVPRPRGRYLAHTKTFYPASVFRLPTGGIHKGEDTLAAVVREAREETGFDVEVTRFLGVVEYTMQVGGAGIPFASYVFLTAPVEAEPHPEDEGERIAAFRDVSLVQVAGIAQTLEALPARWAGWGRFRAIPHRLVLKALA